MNYKTNEEADFYKSEEMHMGIDWDSLEIEDKHGWDAPDFSDAFVSYAEFNDGTPLSDNQLNTIKDVHNITTYEIISLW